MTNKIHTYQAVFLLDNEEVRKGFNQAKDWVQTCLEKHNVDVKVLRLWGERALAYPIGSRQRATYLLGWVEASGESVNEAFRIDNGTTVKMKDSKGKELYGKVVATLKVMGQAGVTVKWNDGTKGNFKNDQFASVSMDRKADYQISESVKTSQDLTEGLIGDTATAVLGAIAGFGKNTKLGAKLQDYLAQQYRIKSLSMDQVNKIKSDGESWQVLKKGDKRVTKRIIRVLNKLDAALYKGADAKSVLAIMDEVTDIIETDAYKTEREHYDYVRGMSNELRRAYYINKNDTDPNDPISAAERKQQQKNYDALTKLINEYGKEVYKRWNGQPHKNISKLEDKMLAHAKEHAKVENKAKAGSDKSLKIWTKKRADLIQKLEAEIKKYQGK
jgi:ribosomal protein S6